jgi:hypothetical protein
MKRGVVIALAVVLVSVGAGEAVTVSNPLSAGAIVVDGQNTGGEWDGVQALTFKTFPGTFFDPVPTAPGDPSTDSFFRAVVAQDPSTNLFSLYTSIEYRSRTKPFVADDLVGAVLFQFLNGGPLVDGGAFLVEGQAPFVFEFPCFCDEITGLPIQAAHGFLTTGPGAGSLFIEMSHQLDVPSGFSGLIPAQTGVTPVTPTEWFSLLIADSEDPLASAALITIDPLGSTIFSPDSLLLPVPEPPFPLELMAGLSASIVTWPRLRRCWLAAAARRRPS